MWFDFKKYLAEVLRKVVTEMLDQLNQELECGKWGYRLDKSEGYRCRLYPTFRIQPAIKFTPSKTSFPSVMNTKVWWVLVIEYWELG